MVTADVNDRNLELSALVQVRAGQHQRQRILDGGCRGKAVVATGRASNPLQTGVDGHHLSQEARIGGLHWNDAERSSSFVTKNALKAELLARPVGTKVQLSVGFAVLLHHRQLTRAEGMACLLLVGQGLEPGLRFGLVQPSLISPGRRVLVEMKA